MQSNKGASEYSCVHFSSAMQKWIVELERHNNHYCFRNECDAGIYAEYYYRKEYNKKVNSPDIDDADLHAEPKKAMEIREAENAYIRLSCKQVEITHKNKTSKYVGSFMKRNRWDVHVQYRGRVLRLNSYSFLEDDAEKKAAMEYDKKALELYCDNAKLNFPI